jgi:hypothetical protein
LPRSVLAADTRLPQRCHYLGAFRRQPFSINRPRLTPEASMPSVKVFASTILGAYEAAQSELIGRAVVLTDGKAGTVESVWLDELHGLRISIKGHDGRWPISTIKFAQPAEGSPSLPNRQEIEEY